MLLRRSRRLSQPPAESSARGKVCESAASRRTVTALIKLLPRRGALHYRMRMADPALAAEVAESPRGDSQFARASSLPRRLGLWSAIAVLVGSTLGSGIFRSPAGIADKLPGPLPLLAIWLTGGLFALCGALTLAEVAGVFPRTGGVYVFIRESWGRLPAFLFGWSELTIIRAASLGAISTTFFEYPLRVLGHDPTLVPYRQHVHYMGADAMPVTASC